MEHVTQTIAKVEQTHPSIRQRLDGDAQMRNEVEIAVLRALASPGAGPDSASFVKLIGLAILEAISAAPAPRSSVPYPSSAPEGELNSTDFGTDVKMLENLPEVVPEIGTTCAICMGSFDDEMESPGSNTGAVRAKVVELPCTHCFHKACLTPWLESHHTCPSCRDQLPKAETSAMVAEFLRINKVAFERVACAGQRTGAAAEYDKQRLQECVTAFEGAGWRIETAVEKLWAGNRDLEDLVQGTDANSAAVISAMLQYCMDDQSTEWKPPDGAMSVHVTSNPVQGDSDEQCMTCCDCGITVPNRAASWNHTMHTGHGGFSAGRSSGNDQQPMECCTCGISCPNRQASQQHTMSTGHQRFQQRVTSGGIDLVATKTKSLRTALSKMRKAAPDEVNACRQMLRTYTANLSKAPLNERFRKINMANKQFEERVANVDGALEWLNTLGFAEDSGHLVLEDVRVFPELYGKAIEVMDEVEETEEMYD